MENTTGGQKDGSSQMIAVEIRSIPLHTFTLCRSDPNTHSFPFVFLLDPTHHTFIQFVEPSPSLGERDAFLAKPMQQCAMQDSVLGLCLCVLCVVETRAT